MYLQYTVSAGATATQFLDVSGAVASVEVGGGERNVGELFTADGDYALLAPGKRTPVDVTVRYVYSEAGSTGVTGLTTALFNAYTADGGGHLGVRWAPKGNSSGVFVYYTGTSTNQSHLVSPGFPMGEVGPGEVIANEFVVRTTNTNIVRGTIA
jgi:hypothetical protein